MSVASAANTAIALCMGKIVNVVNPQTNPTQSQAELTQVAAMYLGIIGGAYLMREVMNVLRRFLVENTCTRIDRDMSVRVVSHLLKVDLSVLAQDQVGALYGRITRGVDGMVRFLRVGFLDFVPALLMGAFALSATLVKQPKIALAMAGVIPVSLGLTIWQLITQKGIRLDLLAQSRENRRHGRRAARRHRLYPGGQYPPAGGPARRAGRRVPTRQGAASSLRDVAFRLRQGDQRGVFPPGGPGVRHLPVRSRRARGPERSSHFPSCILNVMAPLNEIHRFIDEAHESSLRVGDLLGLLA